MAWFHQQKAIRQRKEVAAAKAAAVAGAGAMGPGQVSPGGVDVLPTMAATATKAAMAGKATARALPTASTVGVSVNANRSVGGNGMSPSFAAAPASYLCPSSSSSVGRKGAGSRVERPQATVAVAASATGSGVGPIFSDPLLHQQQQQQQTGFAANGGTTAALFEGVFTRAMPTGAAPLVYPMKQEGLDIYPNMPQSDGVGGSGGGPGSSVHPISGMAWHGLQQQPELSPGSGDPDMASTIDLTALHPAGEPSLSVLLPPQHHQRAPQHQMPQKLLLQWGKERPLSSSTVSTSSATSSPAMVGRTPSSNSPRVDMPMPPDLFAYAQAQVQHQVSIGRGANVQGLDELLLQTNDDDRGEIPEVYEGESDTDDFAAFVAGSVGSGEEEDESLRSLAGHLLG